MNLDVIAALAVVGMVCGLLAIGWLILIWCRA